MNKKGFTLVELLAVIIIISLLALLTSTSVTKILKDAKSDLSNIQFESIKASAESFYSDNLDLLPSNGECKYITLGELKKYGLLDSNIVDPKNNSDISDDLKIKVTSRLSNFGKIISDYEVDPANIDGCEPTFNYIATLIDDADNDGQISIGDKYSVKTNPDIDPYMFYVLSLDEEKVNFIMEQNICNDGTVATDDNPCFVQWNETGQPSDGPVTAKEYLNQATSNWTNLSLLNETYIDEESHYSSITFDGYARLPYRVEVLNAGCMPVDGTCPLWMVNFLKKSTYVKDGTNVADISGYYTASSYINNTIYTVNYSGDFSNFSISILNKYGIRPVISLPYMQIN